MSFDNKSLRCRNCKFWWPVAEDNQPATRVQSPHGECRRQPPAVHAGQRAASWPVTTGDDWCGDHLHWGSER